MGVYQGNVEVFTNKETKKVNIRPNPEGDFNAENVTDLLAFMVEIGKKVGFKPNVFIPEEFKNRTSELVPVLLASKRFAGKPFMAMLTPRTDKGSPIKASPVTVYKPTK